MTICAPWSTTLGIPAGGPAAGGGDDQRGEVDGRDHPFDGTDHPIWRLLPAQLLDRSPLWLHGQSAPAEPLPGGSRARRGAGHPLLALPAPGGSSTTATPGGMAGSGGCSPVRNPSADGILLFSPVAGRHSTESRHLPRLRWSDCSVGERGHPGHWSATSHLTLSVRIVLLVDHWIFRFAADAFISKLTAVIIHATRRQRVLREVEAIEQIVGDEISIRERVKPETLLGELQQR